MNQNVISGYVPNRVMPDYEWMLGFLKREAWMADALCQQVDPDLFFADKSDTSKTRQARKVCKACDVRAQCEAYAVRNNERFGIWGDTSHEQRTRIRKHA